MTAEADVEVKVRSHPSGNRNFRIPGTTSEVSVHKSAVLGTGKIPQGTLKLSGLW